MSNTQAPDRTPGDQFSLLTQSPYLSLERLTDTLRSLVRINSVNPAYGGPPGGELRALEWARDFLTAAGIPARLEEFQDGRFNLRARLDGRTDAPPFLFETHIDTVSVVRMTVEPFAADVEGGRLLGRGATDAKAQVTAMIHALAAWAASGRRPERPVELALVSDEEFGFSGARALVDAGLHPSGIVIGEPTGMRIVSTHKGTIRIWVRVEGKSAHAAKPQLGINAIVSAAAFIEALDVEYAAELARRRARLLQPPTINVGIIEGGLQANLVPSLCRVHLDRRTVPGETLEQFLAELELLLERLHRRRPEFAASLEPPTLVAPPMSTPTTHPLVRLAGEVAMAHGFDGNPIGVDYATDASTLAACGAPIIIVGPGSIDQAHTADEYVELDQVQAGALFYADLIGRLQGDE